MSDRETISATLNSIESSVGANELSAYQVFTRMKRLVQAAQAQAGDGEAVGEVFVDDSHFGNGAVNANIYFGIVLPHGTKLYTAPSAVPVNQQLLEALLEHFVAARFAIDTGMKGTALNCINAGIDAIAAAQQRHGAEGE